MTHFNPSNRPLIEDVVAKFSHIRRSLSGFKLRSPLVSKHKPSVFTVFRRAEQGLLTLQYLFFMQGRHSRTMIHYTCDLHDDHLSNCAVKPTCCVCCTSHCTRAPPTTIAIHVIASHAANKKQTKKLITKNITVPTGVLDPASADRWRPVAPYLTFSSFLKRPSMLSPLFTITYTMNV